MTAGTDIKAEFEALTWKFIETRDINKLMEMYTADALLLIPDHDFLQGREAIRGFWQGFFVHARPLDASHWRLGIIQLEELGDTIFEVGWCFFKIQPESSRQPLSGYAKFILLLKKEGGQWKIAAQTIDNNAPPDFTL